MKKLKPLEPVVREVLKTVRSKPNSNARAIVLHTCKQISKGHFRVALEAFVVATLRQSIQDGLVVNKRHGVRPGLSISCRGVAAMLQPTLKISAATRIFRQQRMALYGVAGALAACTTSAPMRSPAQTPVAFGVKQVNNDGDHQYVLCSACDAPTPKTLASINPTMAAMRRVEMAPVTPVAPPKPVEPVVKERTVKLFFSTGSAALDDSTVAKASEMVSEALKASKVVLQGSTDATGSKILNQRLAERRAEAVKQLLITQGVEQDKISVAACITCYEADNDSANGRQRNRRVDVRVLL
jgi:outer membrane protein OmpA-like peptidoglycan-associated protein